MLQWKSIRTINYGLLFLVFLLIKGWHTQTTTEDVVFLLQPVSLLFGWCSGYASIYHRGQGYYFAEPDILIHHSCSGFNFWMIAFLMLSVLLNTRIKSERLVLFSIPAGLAGAYLLTLLSNTSRIQAALLMNQHFPALESDYKAMLHEGIGVGNNLLFLIACYYIINSILSNHYSHEKLTSSQVDTPA